MQHVRVYAEPVEASRDDMLPVFVDLCVDNEKAPVGKWATLGLAYNVKDGNQLFPFLVSQKNEVVDYGGAADAASDERLLKTDLCRAVINIGSLFSASDDANEYRYRITKLVDRQPFRLFAHCVQNHTDDEDFDQPLFVDVCIGRNNFISEKEDMLGLLGKPDDLEKKPFVINEIGEMDFGACVADNRDDPERLFKTNLHKKQIEFGTEFSLDETGRCIYRINQIVPLRP